MKCLRALGSLSLSTTCNLDGPILSLITRLHKCANGNAFANQEIKLIMLIKRLNLDTYYLNHLHNAL
jgi:hypothetical protein